MHYTLLQREKQQWSQLLNTNLKIQYSFVRPHYAFHFGLWFPLPNTGNVIIFVSS